MHRKRSFATLALDRKLGKGLVEDLKTQRSNITKIRTTLLDIQRDTLCIDLYQNKVMLVYQCIGYFTISSWIVHTRVSHFFSQSSTKLEYWGFESHWGAFFFSEKLSWPPWKIGLPYHIVPYVSCQVELKNWNCIDFSNLRTSTESWPRCQAHFHKYSIWNSGNMSFTRCSLTVTLYRSSTRLTGK